MKWRIDVEGTRSHMAETEPETEIVLLNKYHMYTENQVGELYLIYFIEWRFEVKLWKLGSNNCESALLNGSNNLIDLEWSGGAICE